MQEVPAQETGGRLRRRETLTSETQRELESLRKEVADLRSEIDTLRDFVKALYSLMEEGEQYEAPEGLPASIDFGRINT